MTVRGNRVLWVSAGVAAALWLMSGAINAAVRWNDLLGSSVSGVLPPTIPLTVWAQPVPWPLISGALGLIAVTCVHRFITSSILLSGLRRADFVAVWFAAIGGGGLTGLAIDFGIIIASSPPPRARMLLDGLGETAGAGAYWGLVWGWVPALLVFAMDRTSLLAAARGGARTWSSGRVRAVIAAGAVLALVATGATTVSGLRAARTDAVQAEAIAGGFDPDSGALPDPHAEGTPVPTIAPDPVVPQPDWCTPEQATMLLGDRDAATGHRLLSVRLMNFSEVPCVIDGYPDLAFADQNSNALSVTVEHGTSFMSADPGAQRIEIPAGGTAIAYLGWGANATAGELVASTLFAAPFPGEDRGSWPVQTDIVADSTVTVTAWQIEIVTSTTP